MALGIRRIDKACDFVGFAPCWARLVSESGATSLFLSYDWFWCCWHGVWPQRRPEILVVEKRQSPVAIIPLMHWTERLYGLPVRTIGFLECPHTPMVDVLTIAEHRKVLETFLDHLAGRSDWDTLWLPKIPATSPTVKTLEELLPERLAWRRAGDFCLPYLTIAGEWESFIKGADFRATHPALQDRIEHAGDISLEEHRAVDMGSPILHEVLELTGHSWESDRGVASIRMPRTLEFFRELTRRATKNGWLSLWLLRLKGHIIAMEYQLQSNGEVQALYADQDDAHRMLYPALALKLAILRSLFECGHIHEYRMAPTMNNGGHWGVTGSHEMVHLKLYRPGPYARFLRRLESSEGPGARK